MIPRIDTRMYTNMVLTVIAVVMLATTAQQFGVNIIGSVTAQNTARNLQETATGVAIDSTIPQTQDVAVAQATAAVAAANQQIAEALRDVATAIREAGTDISRSAASRPASSAAGSAASATPAERPSVEVSR